MAKVSMGSKSKLNKSTSTSKAMKASGAGYSTTNSKGVTTMYKSSKDAGGYSDTFQGKGVTSPGTPMGTLDATQIAESNKSKGNVAPLTPPQGFAPIPEQPPAPGAKPVEAFGVAKANTENLGPSNALKDLSVGMANGSITAPKTNIQKGFEATTASGIQPSSDWGQNRMTAKSYTQQPTVQSPVDIAVQQDPILSSLITSLQEMASPKNQRASIKESYGEMIKDSGIEDIDMELIDTKNIIDGSEDDIRTEITKAGGFATDSQVQAMTNARNKSLIKNYNTLLETRNAKMSYIDTMIGLEVQDRQYAGQQFDRMTNLTFQIADYKNKLKTNAQNQFYKIAEATGWDGLYNSAEANGTTSLIEQTLGMPAGGLAQGALKSMQGQLMQQQEHDLDIAYKTAQIRELNKPDTPVKRDTQVVDGKLVDMQTGEVISNIASEGGLDKATRQAVVGSQEYKTISGAIPALKSLTAYKDAITQYGTSEKIDGAAKGKLDAAYGNALVAWKALAALGALSGADFGLAENAVPEPSFFTRKSTQLGKVGGSIDNALSQAESLTQRLIQTYPEAEELLQTQLDDLKISSNPESVVSWDMKLDMDSVINQ